ncbi:MAG: nicotinamidase/pyrazinamidase, partial [Paracoccaceae bacterium]
KLGFAVEVRSDLARAIDFAGSLAAAMHGMTAAGVRVA